MYPKSPFIIPHYVPQPPNMNNQYSTFCTNHTTMEHHVAVLPDYRIITLHVHVYFQLQYLGQIQVELKQKISSKAKLFRINHALQIPCWHSSPSKTRSINLEVVGSKLEGSHFVQILPKKIMYVPNLNTRRPPSNAD